jgi:F-type H+-transporting ATPase subunit epsilon
MIRMSSPCGLRTRAAASAFSVATPTFLTALTVSVVCWRRIDDAPRFCAVRRGVLSVSGGSLVAIATREARVGEDLDHLEQVVLAEFHKNVDAERMARTASLQLQMKAIRQIIRYMRPERPGAFGGGS